MSDVTEKSIMKMQTTTCRCIQSFGHRNVVALSLPIFDFALRIAIYSISNLKVQARFDMDEVRSCKNQSFLCQGALTFCQVTPSRQGNFHTVADEMILEPLICHLQTSAKWYWNLSEVKRSNCSTECHMPITGFSLSLTSWPKAITSSLVTHWCGLYSQEMLYLKWTLRLYNHQIYITSKAASVFETMPEASSVLENVALLSM